jgi:hypothetical protein
VIHENVTGFEKVRYIRQKDSTTNKIESIGDSDCGIYTSHWVVSGHKHYTLNKHRDTHERCTKFAWSESSFESTALYNSTQHCITA